MRVLILGGTGMLGHRLWMAFNQHVQTWATLRGSAAEVPPLPHVDFSRAIEHVNVLDFNSVVEAYAKAAPDVVINCIGLIKQHKSAKDPLAAIDLNARFPHQLAALSAATGSRLIHISTDCVFSGEQGMYREDDPVDAQDVYGRTKALGEIHSRGHVLTLRTSIIGRELYSRYGLLEWFLAQPGPIKGYRQAVFSGFPTQVLADILRQHILPRPDLHGLYHISAEPINKHDLLTLAKDAFGHNIEIAPDDAVVIDRSLDSSRFRAKTSFTPQPWPDMLAAMAADPTPYADWKNG